MKIYTKTGDNGYSHLYNGKKVAKDDLIFQTLGDIDELCAAIGLIDCHLTLPQIQDFRETLHTLVCRLMDISSLLATPTSKTKSVAKLNRVALNFEGLVDFLEKQIDWLQGTLPPLKNFIVPIECSSSSAFAHHARTICRRAERSVVYLKNSSAEENTEDVPNGVLIFMNRLSDYLFALARALNNGFKESIYQKAKHTT